MWLRTEYGGRPVCVNLDTGTRITLPVDDQRRPITTGGAWMIFPNGHEITVREDLDQLMQALGARSVEELLKRPIATSAPPKRKRRTKSEMEAIRASGTGHALDIRGA